MSIKRSRNWRIALGAAIAVMAGWTAWLAAVPGPGTGHSFTTLQSPFTQDLYATTGNLLPGGILGGVAFAPDGRVWSAECTFLGTRLHRFAAGTTAVNGSSVHDEELIVDLTFNGPLGINVGGCGLVNHPDGWMYSSSTAGIWQLNATTGQPVAGPFGRGANGLGIAVDPQPGHHLVYVGDDCHPSLDPDGATCTLWDLDPVTHVSLVFARLTRAEFMLIDGLYFDPSGNFLFAAHRQVDIDDTTGVRSDHNSLQIIRRPAALKPVIAPIDNTQSLPLVTMVSEPDGVAFHAGDGFVVTLNESGDCVDGTNHVVGSNPSTHQCPAGTTAIGGTMTRFDFAGADYTQVPTVSTFALGGFRGDLMQVGADGCIYATQAPLVANGGTLGTRYDNDVTTHDNSLVQICGGFVPPPGVTLPGTIAGLVFLDANHNGVRDSGEGPLADVPVTLSTDPTHPLNAAADGTFLFESLAPGTYTVTTPGTAAYLTGSIILSTAGSSGAISLAAGEHKTGLEFGYAPGSISGTVFHDLNHDAVRDSGEPPISGVTVTLTGAAGGSAMSAVDGSYRFHLLTSGDYTVTAPATTGALALTTAASRAVTLAPGEDKPDVDFGYSAPPLTIACLTPATGQVGVAYSGSAVASGGVAPYTYAIVGTLPPGLTLNTVTGEISGTPTATGTSFSVTVTDAAGASASTATSACPVNSGVTIAPAPLTIACVSPATGQVGVAYSGSAVASGGVTPYAYAIVGTLPAGLTLNLETGEITGTPTETGSFTVKVTDANGAGASTATSACSVTIAPAAPALSCVAATTGQVGVAYTSSLVATGGVGPYTYSIIAGSLPSGLTLNASTGAIIGTPTTAGPFSFTAQVVDARNDAAGTTTGSSCGITIAPAPPALSCVAATTGQVGVAYASSLVATGGVGPYTYSITAGSLPSGLTLNASTGAITGTPTTAGALSFTAQVVDARNNAAGTTTGSSCGITIAPAPPALSCVAATTGQVGVAYSSSLVATGGVGPYTYSIIAGSLPSGLTLNASTGAITGTPTTAGPFSFTAQVVDARNDAAGTTTGSSCGITIAPAAPALACVAATTGQVGVAYTSSLVATGGVGPYTYSIIAGSLPSGLTLNASTGAITGMPTTAGALSFTAQVVDARNNAAGTTTGSSCGITIAPAPLTIACVAAATGQVGVAYSGSAIASGGVAPYTYAIVGTLPAGLTLNAATGQISGTPTAAGAFTVKVTDANGAGASTATSACSVTIAPAAPALSCVAATTGHVGVAYTSSLVATGGVGPYTYSIIAGSLPSGLTLNASTGAITGTPTTAGPFSFTAQVVDARNDAAGTTTGSSCGITIAPAPLTIACVSPATGQVGVAYSGSAIASGGVAPYTYAIVGTLPAGLTLNAATGQISGTPTAAGAFTVKVTDANGAGASTATSACSVTIAPAPLTIACVSPATGQVGVAYSGSAIASGGVAPYTYAIVGTLPAGLTLNAATGQISGTPTAAGAFTVKVTDANGAGASTATSACSVTIAPAPPALSCVAATTGQVGVAYTSSLVATGGVGPYTYSIIAGSLPSGLTLNASTGAITGTPTTAGPFSFTAKVVDARNNAAGTTTSSSCGITIAPAPPALSCVAATTGQVGVAYTSSLVATGGVGPYTYSIIAGSLPSGLTLNASTGAITGTPTTAGPFSFTAKVVDARNNAAGTTTSSSCGITIASVPQAPALSITKSANTTTYTTVGQVIVYTYVIKNTGNVTLTGPFTVTDDKLGVLPCTTATALSPGASITCSVNYTIKASDLGNVLSLPTGVPANIDTGAWLQGVMSTQDTTISGAGPGVPNRIYPGWCIQDHVPTDLHNQPATLYSTIGGNLPASLPNPAVWNKVNYMLNHKIRGAGKSDLAFFKDVQTAVWVLVGEQNPEFGISASAQQMINEANAHPSFVPGPSDIVAVIVYSDGILPLPQIRSGEIQESIIEMEPRASITNLAIAAGKFGTATVTSNQAQATVTQVIPVMAPDVVSLTQSAASAAIATAGLTVGTVTSAVSSIVPAGGVASQTPGAGTSMLSGSAVAIVISSGAPAAGPAVDKMISSNGNGKRTTSAFSTSSAGEVLIALVTSDGPSAGGQTVTVAGAGLTWTLVRRANTQVGTAEIWKATAASVLTNVTVSSTPSAGGYQQSLTVVTFTRATGVGASAAAGAAAGAPTVSLTTTKANALVFGAGNDSAAAIGRTVGPNQQMIRQWIDTGSGDTRWVQAGSSLIPTAGTLFSLNDTAPTADRWNLTAVEIVP